MTTRAAAWLLLGVALGVGACASPPSPTTEVRRHAALEVARDETWVARELRRFRTYRHVDRAYRLTAAGDLDAAAGEFRRYLAIDPIDAGVRFDYLVILHRLHRPAEVIAEADRVLATYPGFAPAIVYRALALQARGDRDAASRDFMRVADHADDPHQQAFALATAVDLALDSGTPGTALASAERLVRARPGVDNHLRHGRVLESLDRYTDADAAYAAALRSARDPADRLRVLAARAVLAEKRRDWDGARRELLGILAADARDASVRRRLGEVAWARKDFKDSARWFRESVAVSGSAEDRERLARALYASSDYRTGVQELRRAAPQVDAADDRHRILMAIAYGHAKLGQTREAVDSFREAAALKADPATLTALAEALIRAGRTAEAASALAPLADRDATGRTHLRIATLYTKSRRWNDALQHLAASAAADQAGPIRTEVYRQQGHILYTLERYADARRAFEQSLQHGGADARLYVALGETCMKLNAYADAVGYLKHALALTDGKPGR